MEQIRRVRKTEVESTRCWRMQLDMLVGVNRSVRSKTSTVVGIKVGVWTMNSSSDSGTAVNKL